MKKRKIIGAAPGAQRLRQSIEAAETVEQIVQLYLASPLVPENVKQELVYAQRYARASLGMPMKVTV